MNWAGVVRLEMPEFPSRLEEGLVPDKRVAAAVSDLIYMYGQRRLAELLEGISDAAHRLIQENAKENR